MTPLLATARLGRIGFGGAPLGNLYAELAEDQAEAVVSHAYARGLRYFDTAPHYGNGLSEQRMGRVLRGLPRDSFALSSKVGRLLVASPSAPREQNGYVGVPPFVQRYDYSYDGALRSIEDSLRRLGLSRLDIVYIHDIDEATHGPEQPRIFREAMEGAYKALARLRSDGTIKAAGLGVNDWKVCAASLAHADFDCFLLAGRYTLLDQTAAPELLPACVARGIRIVLGGPYNSGILASGAVPGARFNYAPASTQVLARVAAIEACCAAFGVPLKAAALQFPLAHPAVATVIPGGRTRAEVDDNIAHAGHPIPARFWRALRERGLLAPALPVP